MASIIDAFSKEQLEEIRKKTVLKLEEAEKGLIDQAKSFADAEIYEDLTDYCYEQVIAYIDVPENMEKILTDAGSFETMYNTIASQEEFKEMCKEELRHFPQVLLMQVISGACRYAVNSAAQVMEKDSKEEEELYQLEALYAKFGKDAMDYANGKNKKFAVQHVE